MPYKSKAQAAAMNAKADRGEIPRKVVDEFNSASKGKMGSLPEHVKKHMASGGEACMSCGGMGYSDGGEIHDDGDMIESPSFSDMLRKRQRGY